MSNSREERIRELERAGRFNEDIEPDPPGRELKPDEIEYIDKSLWQRIKTGFAFFLAYRFAGRERRKHRFIIKDIIGAQGLRVEGGAVLICNHFSPLDSFIIHRTFDVSKRRGRFYRVIKESNYTSFPGFYGFLMRNCNTLPLSSNIATMRKFLRGVDTALKRGDCVLVYPEQSMWHNYRKPRPMKPGAFEIAVRAGVPVIPCFITMEDSRYVGADGAPVQEYTVHVGNPIYPDEQLHKRDRAEKMMTEASSFNKSVYESFYGIELTYEK